jgi:CubicO group peptidase (beta-lactamase class C family)
MAAMVDTDRFERIKESLRRDMATGDVHGAALRVSHNGEVEFDFVEGFADKAAGRKLDSDSVFVTMSTCKPFTAVLVFSLIEKGLLRLHEPVANIIPEFARGGKDGVTLFHLMTHTAGLSSELPGDEAVTFNIEKLTAYASARPLVSQPGERVNYSMVIAHSVLATMCLRVDGRGRTFAKMLADEVFGPLGMKDTSLGHREDLLSRICPVRATHDVPYNLTPPRVIEHFGKQMIAPGAELPAAGCLTTMDDLHRFTEALRRGGEIDGVRIVSPAMIKFCARNYTGTMRNATWDPILSARHWQAWPAYIGIGFRVRGEGITPGPFGMLNSSDTFGHFGAGSSGFWIDPRSGLSCSLLSTGLIEESHNLERTSRLADLVASAFA